MNLFIKYFDCRKVNIRTNKDRCDFYVQEFLKIYEKIIPHFNKYPLNSAKLLDFEL